MRYLAVDFNFLAWYAFHGRGRFDPGAAVASAMDSVQEIRTALQIPGRDVLFAFDRGPYHRASLLPSYKAGRGAADDPETAQLKAELRKRVNAHADTLRANGRRVLWAGGFEADDHLGAAAEAVRRAGGELYLASRDKDLYQLLSPRCRVYDPVKREVYTHQDFRLEWGVHPSQWPEVKAIAGCASDAVPGLDGVGELTAAKYLLDTLPRLGLKYIKIAEFLKTPEYLRNLQLCRLPFPGTPPVRLDLEPEKVDGFA